MPDPGIFCNTPWYELHVYWDGSLGICCQEAHKLYHDPVQYNIATMSIKDWFNSPPVRQFRKDILGSDRLSQCSQCYAEEDSAGHSRRLRSNVKSVIFTRQAFDASFRQSPGHEHFAMSQAQDGWSHSLPIDMHVDLGNHCNLACKMCEPWASSSIAAQQVKWGIESSRKYLGTDWTRDDRVWHSFLEQLLAIPKLKNLHFMGGETLINRRLPDLVDFLTAHQRFDICLSFVTNGTVYPHELIEKMSRFARLGIEVSIETMTEHNQYQRQGTDNATVMRNINLFRQWDNGDNITVALRPAPSILSVGNYHTLLDYALRNQMVIKSNLCINPAFMRAELLPPEIKSLYRNRIDQWASTIDWPEHAQDYNASDPHNAQLIVYDELLMLQGLLDRPAPRDSDQHLHDLVRHCERWDRVYNLDARRLYPEFQPILDAHGYAV